MDLTAFRTLSFDVYGTLIAWEAGIAAVLRPWAAEVGLAADDEALCLPGSLDEAAVDGTVVLCDRGTNARAEKSQVVADAGGVGMALANVDASGLNADWHAVPSVHLDHTHRGEVLEYARTEGATAQVVAGNEGSTTQVPVVAGFSSRGPSLGAGGDLLKPDLSAPGVDVLAAYSPTYEGHSFGYASGTSMSSPHVAGLAALVKQARPDWTPMMIKSAMMTTARDHADGSDPFAGGAGLVEPRRFLDPGLVLDSGPDDWWDFLAGQGIVWSATGEPVSDNPIDASDLNVPSLAIGDLYGTQTVTRTLTDVSGAGGPWTASVEGLDGLDVTVTPERIRPGRFGSQDVQITVTNVAAAAKTWSTGTITWSGPGRRTVRIPVAVRPGVLDAPATVQVPTDATSVQIPTRVGVAGTVSTRVTGLVQGRQSEGAAPHVTGWFDPNTMPSASLPLDYPRGYPRVRIEVESADPEADLDFYVSAGYSWSDSRYVVHRASTSARNEVFEGLMYSSADDHRIHVVAKGSQAQEVPFTLRVFFPATTDTGTLVMEPAIREVSPGDPLTWEGVLHTDGTSPYLGKVEFLLDGTVVDTTTVRVG